MESAASLLAIIIATVTGFIRYVPQTIKTYRTRNIDGLSPTCLTISLTLNIGWIAYLSNQQLWWSLPATITGAGFYIILIWEYHRATSSFPKKSTLTAATLGFTLLIIWITLGAQTTGIILGISPIIRTTPAVATAYKTPKISGISPATWGLHLLGATAWLYYGWFHQDIALLLDGSVGATAAILILARYYWVNSKNNKTRINNQLQKPKTKKTSDKNI